jgi:hypothetical protein
LFHEWRDVDAELRSHYADALTELMVNFEFTRAAARSPDEQQRLQYAWALFKQAIVQHARDIESLMDIRPLELLAPLSISGPSGSNDAISAEDNDLPLAA